MLQNKRLILVFMILALSVNAQNTEISSQTLTNFNQYIYQYAVIQIIEPGYNARYIPCPNCSVYIDVWDNKNNKILTQSPTIENPTGKFGYLIKSNEFKTDIRYKVRWNTTNSDGYGYVDSTFIVSPGAIETENTGGLLGFELPDIGLPDLGISENLNTLISAIGSFIAAITPDFDNPYINSAFSFFNSILDIVENIFIYIRSVVLPFIILTLTNPSQALYTIYLGIVNMFLSILLIYFLLTCFAETFIIAYVINKSNDIVEILGNFIWFHINILISLINVSISVIISLKDLVSFLIDIGLIPINAILGGVRTVK